MKKSLLVVGLLTALGIAWLALNVQAAEDIRKVPVHFKKGASQATIQGHIKGRQTIDYVLGARGGQTMAVNFKAANSAAYFNVLPPGSVEAIFIGQTAGSHFEGKLPKDGDYTIRVYLVRAAARRSESAKYTLNVKITGGEAGVKDEKAHHESQHLTPSHPTTGNLRTYDDPHMAIRTKYPDTMKVEWMGSGEGSGFFFRYKPQGTALDQAQVHIFLPQGAATAAAQEPFVTGKKGLLANNGWKKEGETGASEDFPYGWVKKVMSFTDPKNKGMIGNILLGETHGQAVQVTLYYPGAQGREFLTDAKIILEHLHFKSDKLPLGKGR
jgi:hypothetical protein